MNNAGPMGLVPWNAVLGEDRMMRRSARELLLRKATYDVCETFAADVHIDFQTIFSLFGTRCEDEQQMFPQTSYVALSRSRSRAGLRIMRAFPITAQPGNC